MVVSNRQSYVALSAFFFIVALTSCEKLPASNASSDGADTKKFVKKLEELEEKVSSQAVDASFLESRVSSLENERAEINSTEKAYSIARNQFGAFPIVYRSASAYLDGHKILIDVGNPTEILFSGAELTIEYGPPAPKTPDGKLDWAKWSEYQRLRKTQKTSVTNEFQAGWYTTVEVTLPATKPEEARELRVGIQFNEIRLRSRN